MEYISKIKRLKLIIKGLVQGVGFRPFIYQLAQRYSLCGFVLNNGEGVVVEVEGNSEKLDLFQIKLYGSLPPLARIDFIDIFEIHPKSENKFEIVKSENTHVNTSVATDISMCLDCKNEMKNPDNRRYGYPFINCTNCGPRYSIINNLPYDRKNTVMKKFQMCDKCKVEYENPKNRRYHAQPISCYECGPKLEIYKTKEDTQIENNLINNILKDIKDSKSVAVKGLGGFHIMCDATNEYAIKQLRINKNRLTKPFAVMFESIEQIKKMCKITKADEELILSKERPIVIVSKKQTSLLVDTIAPNIDKIGVFLPYTPLHELILSELKTPIVATSANLSDEPIIVDDKKLKQKMSTIIDTVLTHDREITNACDDSVVMGVADTKIVLRMARGYAPKSFYNKIFTKKKILAVGANQKNTISITFDNNTIISPHIGDLNSLESFEYFKRTLESFKRFYNFEPDIIVCDKHPNYETLKWAKDYVKTHENVELIELQHHYAHALSCMAEYNLDEDVLAFCFDGTGYGDDGVLWGGEVLIASPKRYERVYNFAELDLLGGEKAIKEPKRVALGLLFSIFCKDEILNMDNEIINSFTKDEIETFYLMYKKGINTQKSSSVGRLFDAVYALIGNLNKITYEGEAGLIMEGLSTGSDTKEVYTYKIKNTTIDYSKMILEILEDSDPSFIAKKFINTIAQIVVDISKKYKDLPVVLSGGVFQNKILLEHIIKILKTNKRRFYFQSDTPINDGGISFGQVYYALNKGIK